MSLVLLLGLGLAGCLPVTSDRITAGDFAKVAPEFGALPAKTTLGFAPLPGAHRGFTGADVQRMASQFGIKSEFREAVCFEWSMKRLERADVLKAMERALGGSGVELNEYSLFPAPPGEIVFPASGLNRQAQGASFWRGYVEYAAEKRFPIWAKVRLSGAVAEKKGSDVTGGSKVTVLVRSGAAELKFEAQAITSGAAGQTVTVRNPRSGRSFAAEVTGKDSVLVEAGK